MIEEAQSTAIAPVRKSVTVEAPQQKAFEVFTSRFDSWWPRSHHIAEVDMAEAIIEPREGGRWYEKGVDGSECDWGYVIEWQPPERIVLAWQLNGEFSYDADLVTEVEVRFTAESAERTKVELEHRHLERFGDTRDQARTALDSDGGWGGLLGMFADAATAPAA